MKRTLLTGFRAFAFALGAFLLLAVSGIKVVRSSWDVTLFVLGLAVFWFAIEKILLGLRKRKVTPG